MMPPEAGTIISGRYEVMKLLGQGGYAGTYLARDLKSNSMVALKLPNLNELGDPAVYERFKRELSIGKILQHPDLFVAIDSSEDTPPYLVFHYIETESLAAVLERGKLFSPAQAVEMTANLLDALEYCHSKGVCHRDIKPENLMVGSDGHLKVIDFGIAMMSNSPRVTWRGFSGLVGTPEYMSPEQIKGERGGVQSDIYAVGCLLYHMISGHPPYTGDNPMTVMYQHLTAQPKPLTEINAAVRPGIWGVICHAMRRRKSERYASAAEMAKDLRNLDEVDMTYTTMPDPPMVAVSQSRHLNKLLWILVGVTVIAAVVFCVVLYFLHR